MLSVERGHDPKAFVLVAFGGAGPLHAVGLARALGIRTVAIPPHAGVLSAMGTLAATIRHDVVHTRILASRELTAEGVRKGFEEIDEDAAALMGREGFARDAVMLERWVGMRYAGQAFELPVRVTDLGTLERPDTVLTEAFHDLHRRRYGFAPEAEPVEVVQFGVTATVPALPFTYAWRPASSGARPA